MSVALKPTSDVSSWQQSESTYLVGRSYIDGTDALAIDLERKWGAGRLRLLVDPELRARFDTQRVKFNRAIDGGELEDVKREAMRMQNAWRALDAAATLAGSPALSPLVWEVALPNGKVAAIARSNEDVHAVSADGRRLEVFTLDEIANLLEGYPTLAKINTTWPGEKVTIVRLRGDPLDELNDEIPW